MNKSISIILPEPIIVPVPKSDKLFMLHEDFVLVWNGKRYYLRKDFVTDGASIPPFLWSVVGHPFQPKLLAGAVLHDALCRSKLIPRKDSDVLLRQLARAYKVNRLKSEILYLGVRVGGIIGLPRIKEDDQRLIRTFISVEEI